MKGRISKLSAVALASAIGFATLATLVQAADPISERREAMKGNGKAMKAINTALENGGSAAELAPHANQINDTAMKLATLFPAGTDQPQGKDPGHTMAKPEIWQKPDDFAAAVKKFQEEAAMFKTAVAGGDMGVIKAEFEKLGGACGSCHKAFRAK
ncbi:c-type cytochrome [Dongia deserti]|uniref:c-type cytochrome n=1 Tax=Dongia deserti TaxID=2268030 RepID=UPI000E653BFF|nr:cytochrome c [Dongia deserti]